MTPERWRQVNELFHVVLQQDAAGRTALLDSTASSDPELAAEVRSLLAAHDARTEFLERPAWEAAAPLIVDDGPGPLQPGAMAGHYRIVRELGRGGMGIVYEAIDTRLERAVALKRLPADVGEDPARRERLTREARAAAALSHPAIATIYAFEEIDGTPYLVSELVRGQTLRDELRRGALPRDLLLTTLASLAAGLAAAHAARIVHRDFKPENIIRCADGTVKILDFGLARMTAPDAVTRLRLTRSGMAVGTPGYMAPEQLRGEEVDARADVFAFGVVAWELATGMHPFGADAAELVARMARLMDRPSPVAALPAAIGGLEPILRRCLRPDPADRYASARELLPDVEALARSGSAATPAVAEPRPLRWWKVHQVTIALVVASMPIVVWLARRPGTFAGSRLFLLVLALSTAAVAIRLNLLFTARVHRDQLQRQRRRVRPALLAVEALLGVLLIGLALLTDVPDALAAVLVGLGAATLASLGAIEPATTAAALGDEGG